MRKLFVLMFSLCSALIVFGQLNLDAALQQALLKTEKLSVVQETKDIPEPIPQCTGNGGFVLRAACQAIQDIARRSKYNSAVKYRIKAIDYDIIGGDLYAKNKDAITTWVEPTSFKYLVANCGSSPLGMNPTYEIGWQNTQNIRLSNTFQSTQNKSYSVSVEFSTGGGPIAPTGRISASASTSYSYSTTNAEENARGSQQTQNWRQPINLSVSAHKAEIIQLDFNLKHQKVPIYAEFKVRGSVTLQKIETRTYYVDGAYNRTVESVLNEESFKLSDLVQDSALTFKLEGFYESSQANQSDATITVYDTDLSNDANTCQILKDELKKAINDYNRQHSSGSVSTDVRTEGIANVQTGRIESGFNQLMELSSTSAIIENESKSISSTNSVSKKIKGQVTNILNVQNSKVRKLEFRTCPDCNG
ncbi:MAG: hypothetical protein ACXVBR_14220, partial [Flavisolibacter sp.]